jgi:3-hydroxyisobutyrate dehydrogenase-like beta-hydroxyacid dehydrogenase
VIGICVRDEKDVRAVLSGSEGLFADIRQNAVILIQSTVSPAAVMEFAQLGAQHGAIVMDAAVTGGPDGAAKRNICSMVGGDAAALQRARPFLEAFSSQIIHAGPLGCGMKLKLCNNLVYFIELLAVAEGFRLASASGLDPELLHEVMTANGNLTPLLQQYVDFRKNGRERLGEKIYQSFTTQVVELAEKDLDLGLQFAGDVDLDLGGAHAARQLIARAIRGLNL